MNNLAPIDDIQGFALLAGASLLAGAVNSFAGGGTILTFPVLAAILPDLPGRLVTANTTSTIGLLPGSAAAAWAYRSDRGGMPAWARGLVVPSVAGAIVGTWLLLALPSRLFDALVPWLILTAAVLFAMQPRLTAAARGPDRPATPAAPPARVAAVWGLQFLVSVYGGYFGAGLGILTLAVLGALGLGDIHRLNGVKNVLAMVINGIAAAVYAVGSLAGWQAVSWPHAGVMAVASIAGSSAASHVARRLPARIVRRCVALIGFALAAYYFWRR